MMVSGGVFMRFTYSSIPENAEQLRALSNFSLREPHSTAALFLLTLCRYVQDEPSGIEMINLLKGPVSLSKYEQTFLRDRLGDKRYLPFAYFEGATPANNYTPSLPLTIEVEDDPLPQLQSDYTRVFLHTTGADSKRSVTLRRKGEEYFLWDYPAIVSGIRLPAAEDPWA